jgi:hypothetical protein
MVRRRVSAVSNHGDRTMNQILSFSRSRETLNDDASGITVATTSNHTDAP